MRRWYWATWPTWPAVAALTAGAGGCATGPLLENPVRLAGAPCAAIENPVYVPQGPQQYAGVFEKVMDITTDYFDIATQDRYDGRIITLPRVTPGFERPLSNGAPTAEQRTLATLQSIRQRAEIQIQPANDGGFFVEVKVFRELEDLPRPTRQTSGASFRTQNTVERQFEVIDPTTIVEGGWIPLGRNPDLEQIILGRIKKCL